MKSRPYQRHDREKRLSMIEQRFRQHHVDIQRLWKRQALLDAGIPTTGLAIGVDEEESTGGTHTQCRLITHQLSDSGFSRDVYSSPYTQAGYIRDQWSNVGRAEDAPDGLEAIERMTWPSGNTTGHVTDWLAGEDFGLSIPDDAEDVRFSFAALGYRSHNFVVFGLSSPFKARLHLNGVAVSQEISGATNGPPPGQVDYWIDFGNQVALLPGFDPIDIVRDPGFGMMFRFYKDAPPNSSGGDIEIGVDAMQISMSYNLREYTGCSTSYEPGA